MYDVASATTSHVNVLCHPSSVHYGWKHLKRIRPLLATRTVGIVDQLSKVHITVPQRQEASQVAVFYAGLAMT